MDYVTYEVGGEYLGGSFIKGDFWTPESQPHVATTGPMIVGSRSLFSSIWNGGTIMLRARELI